MSISSFSVFALLSAVLMTAHAGETVDSCAPFGTVHIFTPDKPVAAVAILISGEESWNASMTTLAKTAAGSDNLVIGVDLGNYLHHLNTTSSDCLYLPADFENLSRYAQQKKSLPSYHLPLLIGYASGAALAYAVISQGRPGTFKGAVSMAFRPDVQISKPFCNRNGLQWTSGRNNTGTRFKPDPALTTPWIVLQGLSDSVFTAAAAALFVKNTGSSRLVTLPGITHDFSTGKTWVPQFTAAVRLLTSSADSLPLPAHDVDIGNLPVIELPVTGKQRDLAAVILSGDGGWAGIDKGIAAALNRKGIPVVGFNSLQYFWKARTPEETSADLDKIINHYCDVWKKSRVVIIGYSFGGNVLPFIATRLPAATTLRTALLVFLGLSSTTDFQFHLTDWLGGGPAATARPVLPEIEKLKGRPMLYIYGTDEKDNIAASIDHEAVKVIAFAGGHHFDGNYKMLTDSILTYLR
jgi:type IV secretory pathway VirJ component